VKVYLHRYERLRECHIIPKRSELVMGENVLDGSRMLMKCDIAASFYRAATARCACDPYEVAFGNFGVPEEASSFTASVEF
jgi:hypothetical protein